jgi:radical SAM modification target selenobiotic family peptide
MDTKDIKKLLTGVGIAGLLSTAGAALTAGVAIGSSA